MKKELLERMVAEEFIKVNKHPEADLFIYNYSPKTQYEREWNECTILCRGLIMDAAFNIVARPFPKFFNLEEMETATIPAHAFEVYEKLDGSLGILYWLEGNPYIATRGSFSSEQALVANEMLYAQYAHTFAHLNPNYTYLFEIIYPENRIVVNYETEKSLTLLAIVETQTGKDIPLEAIGFPLVKKYNGITDLFLLKQLEENNREGFVVKFADGLRLKVKFAEYQRIHRIVTQVSNQTIWEHLRDNEDLTLILDRVPDEFYDWVRKTHETLIQEYEKIEAGAKAEFKELETRKETAFYFQTCRFPKILFSILDKRNYAPIIWKMVKPKFEKPFAKYEV